MDSGKKNSGPDQNSGISSRNSLIIRIALFLNYLSKENYQKLLRELESHRNTPDVDVLKIMLSKTYVNPQDVNSLKKTCLSFAKVQEDTRFGSLCIDFNFLTQSNLDLALEEQKRLAAAGKNMMLGDLLLDAGMLSERQRSLILQKQKLESSGRKSTLASGKAGSGDPAEKRNGIPFDQSAAKTIQEIEVTLYVQNDALKVFATKTKEFDSDMLTADLKYLLEKNGIIYGIVDDENLQTFLKDPAYTEKYFEIARGLEPVDGIDARIVYLFEKDYLKAGFLADDGSIDFKTRGNIPFVKQGDVLAKKIPLKDGKDGISIFGDTIPKLEAMDLTFKLGKGAVLSDDSLSVIAAVEGNPKVEPGEIISVNDAYFINGDVDYTTGHVKFDKNVYITGSIKSGFRVEAIDVVANTIDGGIVKARGDVFVKNGVTESTIEARGSIRTGFMHRSRASCMGDMDVVKEIVDTEINIEGTFEMSRGRMFSSVVNAKGGAKIYAIGSVKSKPSVITVGASVYIEKQIQEIDTVIERRQNLLEKKTIEKNRLQEELKSLSEQLTALEMGHQTPLPETDEPNSENRTSQKMRDLLEKRRILESQLKSVLSDVASCQDAVKNGVEKKFALKRLSQSNPSKPILDVAGKILAGTRVKGTIASMVLSHDETRSRIMEINSSSYDSAKKNAEIVITRL